MRRTGFNDMHRVTGWRATGRHGAFSRHECPFRGLGSRSSASSVGVDGAAVLDVAHEHVHPAPEGMASFTLWVTSVIGAAVVTRSPFVAHPQAAAPYTLQAVSAANSPAS